MARNKKGIELPVSMIIVLILSIVIFTFGVTIVFRFFQRSAEITEEIDTATQEQIKATLIESKDIVALPKNLAKARVGKTATFGLGIRNIGSTTQTFKITTAFDAAYTPNEARVLADASNWLSAITQQSNIRIEKDRMQMIPLPIRVGTNTGNQPTQKAIYVFNVCVFNDQGRDCALVNKDSTYDKKIHQIKIEVV